MSRLSVGLAAQPRQTDGIGVDHPSWQETRCCRHKLCSTPSGAIFGGLGRLNSRRLKYGSLESDVAPPHHNAGSIDRAYPVVTHTHYI